MARVAYHMTKNPYIAGGLALMWGYVSGMINKIERPISKELMWFHRREQMEKLAAIFKALLKFKKFNKYQIST